MSRLLKFAAVFMTMLLIAAPLVAAAPCIGIAHYSSDCTDCCDSMSASMGSMSIAAMMTHQQDQFAQVTCCKTASSETAGLAITQEPRGPVSPVANRTAVANASPFLAEVPLQRLPTPPWRQKSDRVYSDLCTYRI